MREIDELDAMCTGGRTSRAYTAYGPIIDNYTELYMPFFYNENVLQKAGTLMHEARHADWCGHSGNSWLQLVGKGCISGSTSCDKSFEDGCSGVGSPSGKGANGVQALWLWWFTFDADNFHGTNPLRDMARDEANRILDTMFDEAPCFNITRNGAKVVTGVPLDGTCIASQKQ